MGILQKLGLERPALRAWAMYDWANSAFFTTIVTAVFPVFYKSAAAQGLPENVATARFAIASAIGVALVALLSPPLGVLADRYPLKKRLLGGFMAVGVLATLLMAAIQPGQWWFALTLFTVGNVGVAGSLVFYDSLLPHLAPPEEVDRVSTAGYAIGYLGGGLLLALNLAWIMKPALFGIPSAAAAVKLSFVSVGLWWAGFSIPLFRRVPEPPIAPQEREDRGLLAAAILGLKDTLRDLKRYPQAFLLMIAFFIYNDGIQTVIRMATIYGKDVGLDAQQMLPAVLLVQFLGIPFSFLFGQLAGWTSTKTAILIGLGVYVVIAILGFSMQTATDFFVMALLVGVAQGGCQALSRSLFAQLIPTHKSSEFFGLFSVFSKFAGVMGPLVIAAFASMTGSSRGGVLAVAAFFILGGFLLSRIDIAAGRAQAGNLDCACAPLGELAELLRQLLQGGRTGLGAAAIDLRDRLADHPGEAAGGERTRGAGPPLPAPNQREDVVHPEPPRGAPEQIAGLLSLAEQGLLQDPELGQALDDPAHLPRLHPHRVEQLLDGGRAAAAQISVGHHHAEEQRDPLLLRRGHAPLGLITLRGLRREGERGPDEHDQPAHVDPDDEQRHRGQGAIDRRVGDRVGSVQRIQLLRGHPEPAGEQAADGREAKANLRVRHHFVEQHEEGGGQHEGAEAREPVQRGGRAREPLNDLARLHGGGDRQGGAEQDRRKRQQRPIHLKAGHPGAWAPHAPDVVEGLLDARQQGQHGDEQKGEAHRAQAPRVRLTDEAI